MTVESEIAKVGHLDGQGEDCIFAESPICKNANSKQRNLILVISRLINPKAPVIPAVVSGLCMTLTSKKLSNFLRHQLMEGQFRVHKRNKFNYAIMEGLARGTTFHRKFGSLPEPIKNYSLWRK